MLRCARHACPIPTKVAILPEASAVRRVRPGVPPLRAARGVPRRGPGRASRLLLSRRCRRSARPTRALVDRRARAGDARRQRERPAVHRRLRGHPALRDAARVRLRDRGRSRRRATTASRSIDCRITNAVKCLPPGNKPTPAEVRDCNGYLAADLARVPAGGAILALGRIAHDATLRALGRRPSAHPFAHGARHALDARRRALRQLPLQPLQHQHAASHAGDVRAGVRRHRAPPACAPTAAAA